VIRRVVRSWWAAVMAAVVASWKPARNPNWSAACSGVMEVTARSSLRPIASAMSRRGTPSSPTACSTDPARYAESLGRTRRTGSVTVLSRDGRPASRGRRRISRSSGKGAKIVGPTRNVGQSLGCRAARRLRTQDRSLDSVLRAHGRGCSENNICKALKGRSSISSCATISLAISGSVES
jgi:hypothetical protein